jgi:CheY-like chemotaxis protein/predicted kinase
MPTRGKTLVAVGGHPFSGKASLASGLAAATRAPLVRYADTHRHSRPHRRHDELCERVALALDQADVVVTAAPLSRREHREPLAKVARQHQAHLVFVECTCDAEAMQRRIETQFAHAAPAFLELRVARARGQQLGYQPAGDELGDAELLRVDGARPATELVDAVLASIELPPRPQAALCAPVTRPAAKRPLVLVIDDDQELLATLAEMLALLDCKVATAGTGAAALSWASQAEEAPDLVLLDYLLPGMSGLELAPHLRQRFPDAEIVVLSAHDEPWLCDEAFRDHICEYLRKPVSAADLIHLLDDLAPGAGEAAVEGDADHSYS